MGKRKEKRSNSGFCRGRKLLPYGLFGSGCNCGLCELFFSSMYGIAPSSGYTEDDQLLAEAGERMAGSYARLPEFDSVLLQAVFVSSQTDESYQNAFDSFAGKARFYVSEMLQHKNSYPCRRWIY